MRLQCDVDFKAGTRPNPTFALLFSPARPRARSRPGRFIASNYVKQAGGLYSPRFMTFLLVVKQKRPKIFSYFFEAQESRFLRLSRGGISFLPPPGVC